jgi:hypothetical protein
MARTTERQLPIFFDSRWRRIQDPLNSIQFSIVPVVNNAMVMRLADLTFQRAQPVLTGRSIRWMEVPVPGNAVAVLAFSFNDTDASLDQVQQALAAGMTNQSAAGGSTWTYAVAPNGTFTVTLDTANPNQRLILEPTQSQIATYGALDVTPEVVTQRDFQERMGRSILYELGFNLTTAFNFTNPAQPGNTITFAATQASRLRGDDVVFVRVLVNGREVGDTTIARTPRTEMVPAPGGGLMSRVTALIPANPMTFLGRLSLTATQGGTAFMSHLPWTGSLSCEKVEQFRIEFWRYANGSFEPYDMRGNDYSGVMQVVSQSFMPA